MENYEQNRCVKKGFIRFFCCVKKKKVQKSSKKCGAPADLKTGRNFPTFFTPGGAGGLKGANGTNGQGTRNKGKGQSNYNNFPINKRQATGSGPGPKTNKYRAGLQRNDLNGTKEPKENVCPEGKILNPKTGRCIIDKTKKVCPEGKILNPKTGRCIIDKTKKVCPEGKILNPKTGRCIIDKKKKVCPEGKILNPKTGRCINKGYQGTRPKPRTQAQPKPKPRRTQTKFSKNQEFRERNRIKQSLLQKAKGLQLKNQTLLPNLISHIGSIINGRNDKQSRKKTGRQYKFNANYRQIQQLVHPNRTNRLVNTSNLNNTVKQNLKHKLIKISQDFQKQY